jgi:alkylation response protein AidB-like acyl-CoA dehydrogenase
MNYDDSPAEGLFRRELRAWLATNIPAGAPDVADEDRVFEYLNGWHRRLASAGWVGLTLPLEGGGRGLDPIYDAIFNEELAAAGRPAGAAQRELLGKEPAGVRVGRPAAALAAGTAGLRGDLVSGFQRT